MPTASANLSTKYNRRPLVLSTIQLIGKDRNLIKSLFTIFAGKLNKNWIVSSSATEGDLLISYDLHQASSLPFQKYLILSALEKQDEKPLANVFSIEYPIRTIELINALNRLTFEPQYGFGERQNESSGFITRNTKRAVSFLHRFIKHDRTEYQYNSRNRKVREKSQKEVDKALGIAASFNFVLLGPPGSGKTTSIRSLSPNKLIDTDAAVSDELSIKKSKTTVAIDYGEIELDGKKIKLYGNPGQNRFSYMWEVTCWIAHGFIILLDVNSADVYEDLAYYYQVIERYRSNQPVMIAFTHIDCHQNFSIDDDMIRAKTNNHASVQVCALDPRSQSQALELIQKLLDKQR